LAYEFWIPAALVALAGPSLLIDFDGANPLEPSTPEQDHDDLSLLDEISDDFDVVEVGESGSLAGYLLVAANDPQAPSGEHT
jgi:hypothetical protein